MFNKKKKILVVNRDFQYRYTLDVVLVGILTTILSISIILAPLYIFQILRIPKFLPTPILITMGVAIIVNIVVVSFITVAATHRVAGPMFALNKAFRSVELGRLNAPLKVRNTDEMQYIIKNYNLMISSLVKMTNDDIATIENIISSSSEKKEQDLKEELLVFKRKLEARVIDQGVIGTIAN